MVAHSEIPTLDTLPAEFSPDVLRARYPDLAGMDDVILEEHYRLHGRNEGRATAEVAFRENFVGLVPKDASVLEIGPFCQPVFTGPKTRYLDVLDANGLRERAREIGLDPALCPAEIHYTQGLEDAAGAAFDAIFSSHNIEHQPDPVSHLNQAAAALAPGGLYLMLVPDKRYCFGHFIPETTLADILGAHAEKRSVHTAAHVIEHVAFTCHNDSLAHWHGDHGPPPDGLDGRVEKALSKIEEARGGYIDVHAWQFTPTNFRQIMGGLHRLGLSPFELARVYQTPYGRNEFAAILSLAPAA